MVLKMAAIVAAAPVRQRRQRRIFRHRASLADLRDGEVLSRYRLSREGIFILENALNDDLMKGTKRSQPIPVLTQVLIGLRYLAKGDLLSEVADLHGVSRSSACHIIDRFVEAVNHRFDNISFPDGREIIDVKQGFYRKCRIPNTVGAVDGTLIPIIAPAENEEVYVCRKNFHAINVQACVDHKARFTDIVSKWPGSTHDASVFDNCSLKGHLERTKMGHLLGDSGYPLKKHLLTPVLNPDTQSKRAYNQAHSSGRMVVERAFGLLKSRFRCLHKTGGVLYKKPGKCCKIIVACARLHNFCLEKNIPMPENPPVVVEREEERLAANPDVTAIAYRQHIIELF